MLVVYASLLSFSKLSILVYYRAQVLASIQFSSVRFLGWNIGTEKIRPFLASENPTAQFV